MKNRLLGPLALLFLCHGLSAQQAQNDSIPIQDLDEVVVSDSRFALKRENSGKAVIKISAEELQRNQGRSVAEIINTKSGIAVNGSRSQAGQNISVFARGGNNRQVLVIIDGIQVSDPSNVNAEFDLRLLNPSQIERIEIVKGAASTLYGNAAATVVINITTKKASQDGFSLETTSIMGTNQSKEKQGYNVSDFSNTVALSGKSGKLSVLASGGHQFTDGLSAAVGDESDAFSRINGNVKVGYAFSTNLELSATAFYDKLNNDFDNGFPVEDANFTSRSEQSRFALSSIYRYGKGSLHFNGAFNSVTRSFQTNFPNAFDSESWILDVFNKYTFNEKLYTIVGVNAIEHKTLFSETEETATTIDPYINGVWISDFGLNLNAGLRLNNHSEYGSNLIYNLNPSYRFKLGEGYLKFFGSYATSFIAPNLSQLFGPFGPNPDLEPEENTTLEGGIEYRPSEKLRFSAVYFDRKEENRIQFVTINPETFESQYQNIATPTNFNGLEVELEVTPIEKMSFNANYTFTDAEEGLGLRIPKNVFNAIVGYEFNEKTDASLSYQHTSDREDTDFSTFETVTLESFGLWNAYLSHQLNKQVRFFVSMENITNTAYFEILNFTTRGRNFRLGLQLSL
ncbi:TonB-dependent receptor [Allomuricauda sp. d1]|uniref:TonB-dependent receptor plug domain-containing protein n=1 Tax=Allomuricauda sp. d1 TaxID=3136725 RepID=UPI0031D56C88